MLSFPGIEENARGQIQRWCKTHNLDKINECKSHRAQYSLLWHSVIVLLESALHLVGIFWETSSAPGQSRWKALFQQWAFGARTSYYLLVAAKAGLGMVQRKLKGGWEGLFYFTSSCLLLFLHHLSLTRTSIPRARELHSQAIFSFLVHWGKSKVSPLASMELLWNHTSSWDRLLAYGHHVVLWWECPGSAFAGALSKPFHCWIWIQHTHKPLWCLCFVAFVTLSLLGGIRVLWGSTASAFCPMYLGVK